MLSRISIRWRIVLFHILTLLGLGALLTIGMFAVFGIAVSNSIEDLTSSRANEAARIVETTGTLTPDDLASLNRDDVFMIALDENGRVLSQIGAGVTEGSLTDSGIWRQVLAEDRERGGEDRALFTRWDNDSAYTYTVPVHSEASDIRVIEAGVTYDRVGQDQFEWVTFAFVGFGILAFILITIGSIYLVRYSLAPVTAIAEAAAEIGAADLSRRLPVRSGRDELGHLATTFNALLDRLETAFTDREEALAYQRRFVADASHELRTPLTSIMGYTRMLRDWGLQHPEASAEAVARMEAEAVRMQSLVEGLLHRARGDEAGLGATAETDLGQLVLDAVDLASVAGRNDLGFDLQVPPSPVMVLVDQEAMLQVLGILLDNARKFSPPGGTIVVALEQAGEAVTVSVGDAGPGIAPEHQDRIFERFYRVDASRTTRGAGLGLAIAKDIVERHGGSISVASEPGHGATFAVRLPLPPAPGRFTPPA